MRLTVTGSSTYANIQFSNKSYTLPFENRKNIAAIALSPDGNTLLSVDEDGRALLANFRRRVVLHHFNFKKSVRAVKFSPNGKFIAATHDSHVQVWKTPNHLMREFAPFELHRTYTGHNDEVMSIEWSPDSKYVVIFLISFILYRRLNAVPIDAS